MLHMVRHGIAFFALIEVSIRKKAVGAYRIRPYNGWQIRIGRRKSAEDA